MRIAIIGPGGIGSTFALQLAKAGHHITVVARGARLDQLRCDGAIVTAHGERAAVEVAEQLDPATDWDLVLVTVLASQVEVLLPDLGRSAAQTVMFMFNTVESFDRLRTAVGSHRFAFGFPSILASVNGGLLTSRIVRRGMLTTVTDPLWAKLFSDAGIPTTVHSDMQSWLRSHAALVVPLMVAGNTAYQRGAGLSRAEGVQVARAMQEGFRLVRHLGSVVTPTPVALLSRAPAPALAALLWTLTRGNVFRRAIAMGPSAEARALIDQMSAVWPGHTPALVAIRP